MNLLFELKKCYLGAIARFINISCKMDIKTFIFFDCETTGLPYQENNKTRITELCFTVVESEHLQLGVFPRVQHKLNLCFNPGRTVNPTATEITGLSNDLLEFQPGFTHETVSMINKFLESYRKPLCFVAHNGNRFDYPILRAHIHKTNSELLNDILCIDSLEAFRELHLVDQEIDLKVNDSSLNKTSEQLKKYVPFEFSDNYDEILCEAALEVEKQYSHKLSIPEMQKNNETTPKKQIITNHSLPRITKPEIRRELKLSSRVRKKIDYGISFKLIEVYARLTKKEAVDAHRAESDVLMLIECAATLGTRFTDWANFNAKKFSEIPILTPGKKL